MNILAELQKYTDYSLGKSKEQMEIKYENTSFEKLVFTGFDLNNTEFLEVIFNNCDFTDVYLSGSNLSGSTDLDSFRTSFYGSCFNDLIIENSIMKNCFIARANLSNIVFKNTDLTNTSFKHSMFSNVRFVDCKLDGVNFEDVEIF